MKHVVTYLDGSVNEFSEGSESDIIVSTGEYPKLGAQVGMFSVTFSTGVAVYIPFDNVKKIVTLPTDRDVDPTEE